jgi:hypothetical protein
LHDQYQRNDILCPGLLSFAAGVISPRGGFRVEVRETLAEFDELADCARYWVARTEWRDINAPYLIVRDPVVWADIPWLIRECELAILAWLRAQNDPDAWEIPGLKEWFRRRNKYHIGRIGRDEYAKQYREFWNRDLAIGVIS